MLLASFLVLSVKSWFRDVCGSQIISLAVTLSVCFWIGSSCDSLSSRLEDETLKQSTRFLNTTSKTFWPTPRLQSRFLLAVFAPDYDLLSHGHRLFTEELQVEVRFTSCPFDADMSATPTASMTSSWAQRGGECVRTRKLFSSSSRVLVIFFSKDQLTD